VLQTVDTGPNTFAKSPSRYFRLFRFLHRFNLTVHPSLAEFLDKVDFQGHVFVG
jgi:tRNA nucleotidyltransferase/poly(A) polymerase